MLLADDYATVNEPPVVYRRLRTMWPLIGSLCLLACTDTAPYNINPLIACERIEIVFTESAHVCLFLFR